MTSHSSTCICPHYVMSSKLPICKSCFCTLCVCRHFVCIFHACVCKQWLQATAPGLIKVSNTHQSEGLCSSKVLRHAYAACCAGPASSPPASPPPASPTPASPTPSGTAGIGVWLSSECVMNTGTTTTSCATATDLSGNSYPDASCCSASGCYDSTTWDGTTPKDPFFSKSSAELITDVTCSPSYTSACCPLAPQGP